MCAVGQVVHTLPEGKTVAGVTSLADGVYVLREKERDQVEVYDVINYRLQRCLTVPNRWRFHDMTSCEHYRCLYTADDIRDAGIAECVHRLDVGLQGAYTRWPVNDEPLKLSVTAARNVLVTCWAVRKIKEFSSHGDLLRELTLPDDVEHPWHAIQLTSGQFIVSHGRSPRALHRVCKISSDGNDIVNSHGGQRSSEADQFWEPRHLAVDSNEFVFVADLHNQRITLLSPTIDYVRQVELCDKLNGFPSNLFVDAQRRRLYVSDIDSNYFGQFTSGRVVVCSI